MSKELESRLASLTPDRIKMLVDRLQASPAAARPRVERMPRVSGGRYPLSGAQERMWFLCQLSPGSPVFNNPAVLRIRPSAPLDRARLERSLHAVMRRHEILRTTFHEDHGTPAQVVHAEMTAPVGWQDLRALPRDAREQSAARAAYDEGRRPFDLTAGPLMAVTVLHLDELEYLLLVTSHHIISDGWSNALFSKELSAIYSAGDAAAAGLPAPDYQYVDYVQWERAWSQSGACQRQIDYWKRQLEAPVPPLRLPADRPRPAVMSHDGGMVTTTVPHALAQELRRLAKDHRLSLFQVLTGGLVALLFRYIGETTITIGTLSANRNRREVQGVMGLFMNTLVIRADVDGDGSFVELARRVQTISQEALANQDLPFDRLVTECKPPRQLNVHPIFQVMFVHQNVPALYEVPGMALELVKIDYGTSKFDLNLWAEEVNDELRLTLYYARDLFEPATAARVLDHYGALLESAVRTPERAIGDLPYFASPRSIDPGTTEPAVMGDAVLPIHRRFEAQVRRTPDALAVEGPGGAFTYAELNTYANRVAHCLRRREPAADAPIAVMMDRSPRAIAAIMGILKAGAAYLPLDPSNPPARLDAVLRDAGSTLLLTDAGVRPAVDRLQTAVAVVDLDADADDLAAEAAADPAGPDGVDRLAYVIYTSGTTGTPKGVAVEHRNLSAYCDAIWPVMALSPADRCATVSSLAADLGNTMIFPPLLAGASVIVVPEEMTTDAAALASYFSENGVDAVKIVPSHLRALLASAKASEILPKKLVVLGGESCPAELVRSIRAAAPALRVLNHYGPTETAVGVLTFEPGPADTPDTGDTPLPIGFPLAGSRVYVLDAARRPVPPGVSGEIYIGGTNVARGYLNRPDLTATRFVDDPFMAGARLYRTGDRAAVREDGAIVFQGRMDRQVKIRGFRIELAEIESALAAHADVAQAVVQCVGESGAPRLVACVQARPGAVLDAGALGQYLRGLLPPPMVPQGFVFVEAMPLTPNGKIDYDALARLEAAAPASITQPPRDSLELELTHIWRELLGAESVGIDDNFFDLGGHSLLATQLMARVEDHAGVRLPLATLFEHGTIRGIAACLRADGQATASPLVAIRPGGGGAPIVFVHPAGGNVLCYYELARALDGNAPFFGLQAIAGPAHTHGNESIEELARTYVDALLARGLNGDLLLGGWSMGALVAFEMASVLGREHGRFPTVAVLDQLAPGVRPASKDDELSRMVGFAAKVSELVGHNLGITRDSLAGGSADDRAAVFLERFIRHQLAPETTSVADFRGFLELMLMHNRMTGEYTPPPYPGRILVVRAEDSGEAGPAGARPPDLGWQPYSLQPVETISAPGTHISMMRDTNVRVLAGRLSACLLHPEMPLEAR